MFMLPFTCLILAPNTAAGTSAGTVVVTVMVVVTTTMVTIVVGRQQRLLEGEGEGEGTIREAVAKMSRGLVLMRQTARSEFTILAPAWTCL